MHSLLNNKKLQVAFLVFTSLLIFLGRQLDTGITNFDDAYYAQKAKEILEDFDKFESHFWLVVPAATNIRDLLKETTFDGTGVKMSSLVSRYDNSGLVFEKVFYTQGANVKIKEFYVYSENKLMEIIKEDGQGNVFERLVYQRF